LAEPPDIVVHLDGRPAWGAEASAAGRVLHTPAPFDPDPPVTEAAWVESGAGVRVRYADGVTYWIRHDGREIWCTWPSSLTLDDAVVYLLGSILGYAVRRTGVLSLHASAVVIDGRGVAFVGASGAGKSTLAGIMAKAGHAVLADDVLAVRFRDAAAWAYPSVDHLRVWGDSASALVGEGHSLSSLARNWDKFTLPIEETGLPLAAAPAPLGALVLLDPDADLPPADALTLHRVAPAAACIALLPNTSANFLLDSTMRAHELRDLTRLLSAVPVYRLVGPASAWPSDGVAEYLAHALRA
jgi:hypothetical protein